jgi:hypothetical protein
VRSQFSIEILMTKDTDRFMQEARVRDSDVTAETEKRLEWQLMDIMRQAGLSAPTAAQSGCSTDLATQISKQSSISIDEVAAIIDMLQQNLRAIVVQEFAVRRSQGSVAFQYQALESLLQSYNHAALQTRDDALMPHIVATTESLESLFANYNRAHQLEEQANNVTKCANMLVDRIIAGPTHSLADAKRRSLMVPGGSAASAYVPQAVTRPPVDPLLLNWLAAQSLQSVSELLGDARVSLDRLVTCTPQDLRAIGVTDQALLSQLVTRISTIRSGPDFTRGMPVKQWLSDILVLIGRVTDAFFVCMLGCASVAKEGSTCKKGDILRSWKKKWLCLTTNYKLMVLKDRSAVKAEASLSVEAVQKYEYSHTKPCVCDEV